MRATMPTVHCDDEQGCDEWDHDYYEQTASTVNGVRITETRRAPGWLSDGLHDYCPEHAKRWVQ